MKIFRAQVTIDGTRGIALHFIEVEKDELDRTKFHFRRIIHNLDDLKKFPIPEMAPATFQEQLRSLNRAFAITVIVEKDIPQFIENILKEAYPERNTITIEELR